MTVTTRWPSGVTVARTNEPNLADHFDAVLDAVESQDGWVTNRVTPGKIILGELGGIETGIRQLVRRTPFGKVTPSAGLLVRMRRVATWGTSARSRPLERQED